MTDLVFEFHVKITVRDAESTDPVHADEVEDAVRQMLGAYEDPGIEVVVS